MTHHRPDTPASSAQPATPARRTARLLACPFTPPPSYLQARETFAENLKLLFPACLPACSAALLSRSFLTTKRLFERLPRHSPPATSFTTSVFSFPLTRETRSHPFSLLANTTKPWLPYRTSRTSCVMANRHAQMPLTQRPPQMSPMSTHNTNLSAVSPNTSA